MELVKDDTQVKQDSQKKQKRDDEIAVKESKEMEAQSHFSQWQCETCHLFNSSKDWACVACFSKLRKWDAEIPKKMKGLVKENPNEGYLYTELDVPEPMEGELLIKSCGVGICGSDIILFKWTKDAQTIAKLPFTPGHEAAGLVVKKGPKTKMKVGTRVAIENHFYCGECKLCQEKRGDICLNMSQFGHGKGTIYGGCSEYFIVKEIYCYRLRTNISWKEATLLEPLGVAHNAVEQVELGKSSELLVTGCGTIGLFVVSVAKALGCRKIIASDVLPWKLELAKKMGADELINVKEQDLKNEVMKLTDGIGVQTMIECSGISEVTNMSFSLLRKGGRIVLVGLPKQPLHVENVLKDVIFKSLQLRTIHGRRIFHTWKEVEKLIAEGKIPTSLVVSHYLPLSEWKKGYDALLSGEACKVLFDPTL